MNQNPTIQVIGGRRAGSADSRCGFSLVEVAVALTLVGVIVLGVLATVSTAAASGRSSGARLDSQMLLNQVIEEIQGSPYDTLLGFHGTFVVEGDHRADISAVLADVNLVQIQVDVASQVDPSIASRGVLLVADTE